MDDVVEALIDSQLRELLSTFKPQFGNQQHIDISTYAQAVNEKEKLLKEKKKSAAGAKKIEKELSLLKRNLVHLLKNQ